MAPFPGASASKIRPLPQLPDWVNWLQAGSTVLLAVLFLVMVGKTRQQGVQILELQERLQGLENSRALDRTTGMEEQLRSTVERLQVVERNSSRIEVLSAEAAALKAELQRLRRSAAPGSTARPTAPPPPLPPAANPEPAAPEAPQP